ncbi:MAG: S1 RNA-binding domain-containing protein [Pirellulaceae bacterium]
MPARTVSSELQASSQLELEVSQKHESGNMIDLNGVARQLRLNSDQIRIAADLLEQGYQPSFIARYRADETGSLSQSHLWILKREIDRQKRLIAAREKVHTQLPKDAELDEEANGCLQEARSNAEIEIALRCWRARRNLSQLEDTSSGALLEKLIAYDGSKVDIQAWVGEQNPVEGSTAEEQLLSAANYVSLLMQGDTRLAKRLRIHLEKKAQLQIEFIEEPSKPKEPESKPQDSTAESVASEEASSESQTEPTQDSTSEAASSASGETTATATSETPPEASTSSESLSAAAATNETPPTVATEPANDAPQSDLDTNVVDSDENVLAQAASESHTADSSNDEPVAEEMQADPAEAAADANAENEVGAESETETAETESAEVESWTKPEDRKKKTKKESKSLNKLTPRQRRRRWLMGMLQPMKSVKKNITKLTAYQQLILGRGRRSQLVKTVLGYDNKAVCKLCRDAFVGDSHPFAKWFEDVVAAAFESSIQSKIEADTLATLEERAQEKLFETATENLRSTLMQRPVRGHVILVVDTIGPKSASVAVVSPEGRVLHTDEVVCSARPEAIDQNMVRLGEIAHRYKVTLIALTNGPGRRFLILSIRKLIEASDGKLRWTMADRGGADAYATSRCGLKELPSHNRRDRAAIWVGRSLLDPMLELLKVDANRLRLGSYQRELPQEPLRELVQATVADCLSARGLDVHNANEAALKSVAGVHEEQAKKIVSLADSGSLISREQLVAEITPWEPQDAKQAIGFLRVYGSEQPFDATLIHPDDYKLAERLVSNTELPAPPNAPDEWSKPEPKPAKTASDANADSDSTTEPASASSTTAEIAADTSNDDSSETTPEGGDEIVAANPTEETSPAEETTAPEPASETTVTAEPAAQDSSAEEATSSEENPAANNEAAPDSPPADGENLEASSEDTVSDAAGSESEATATASQMTSTGYTPEYSEDVVAAQAKSPGDQPTKVDAEKLARGWQVGRNKLRWIAQCLESPFADPRLSGTPLPMLSEVPTLQSLKQEQCLWAVVVGVADFGAFVELGPDCSGLIHISRLSAHYVEDPHQAVQVGDLLKVWVVSIDEKKNRVALTALSPAERRAANLERNERGGGRGDRDQRGSRDQGGRQGGQKSYGDRTKSGDGRPSGSSRPSGSGRPGGGRPGGRPGQGNRGRQGGGRGNRRDEHRTSKPVIVQSKKPKENITDAMKEGEAPLRSFSDLMQFYEAKRTDPPAPAPKGESVRPSPEPKEPETVAVAAAETQEANKATVLTPAPVDVAASQAPAEPPTVESTSGSDTGSTAESKSIPEPSKPSESDSAS